MIRSTIFTLALFSALGCERDNDAYRELDWALPDSDESDKDASASDGGNNSDDSDQSECNRSICEKCIEYACDVRTQLCCESLRDKDDDPT